jgi:predicted RNA binding protein YcfA (HicA-like mRNA interferase family)
VTKRGKLLAAMLRNRNNVRFVDACKIAESLGFRHKGGKGSHRAFGRPDEPDLLTFQDRSGYVPPYQARQLIRIIEKYGEADDEISD